MVLDILLQLSTGVLGIFLGTQIAEALLIVPYWKSKSPDDFFAFYKTYGKGIHQFYAPITIAATILPVLTLIWSLLTAEKTSALLWLMLVFTLLFFASYFVYFKQANNRFSERSISNDQVSDKLTEWGKWHWGRVVCEFLAFVCALLSLSAFN